MPRTVSASEAKNRLGAVMAWARAHRDDVVIESRGKPAVVIMPFEQYEELQHLRDQARRQEALARLDALRERVSARNADLSDEAAAELAERAARGMFDDAAQAGRMRFARDRR